MTIKISLQPHNGKFEGELEIIPGSAFDSEIESKLGLNSVLVSICITTMHHDSRSKAKTATKRIISEVIERLQKELL